MNGPEHYTEAEKLLKLAADGPGRVASRSPEVPAEVVVGVIANVLAEAQVHATLALAAAAAEAPHVRAAGDGWPEWQSALM